jgi:hypothetical protein
VALQPRKAAPFVGTTDAGRLYTVSRKASPTNGRRVRSSPRVLKVSSAGSVNFRRRKINIGQAYSSEHVRVIDGPENVMIRHADTGEILQLVLGPVGTYHGSGAKRRRPSKPPADGKTVSHLPTTQCQPCVRTAHLP